MAILALDLATVTGWALHEEGMEAPFFGSVRFPSIAEENGPTLEGLRVLLGEKHAAFGLTEIVFEAQHIADGMGVKNTYKLIGMGTFVEWFAFKIGARCYSVPIGTWRKHFIGIGNLPREAAKRRCLATCQRLGWHTMEEDAAEACGILDCYLSMKTNYERPWRDDLLMGGAAR